MSRMADAHRESEGRRGSRIDFEEGGRYLGMPRNGALSGSPSVQGTGCGTGRGYRDHEYLLLKVRKATATRRLHQTA